MKFSCIKFTCKNSLNLGKIYSYGNIPALGGSENLEAKKTPEVKEKITTSGVPINAETNGELSQYYKLNAISGLEDKGLKSEVQINMPNLADEKYLDEKGQKKTPKVIIIKRVTGPKTEDNDSMNKKMLEYVEQRRKNGEPVVLIMQSETNESKNSKDLDDPETIKKIIAHAEKLTGASLTKNVAMATIGGSKKIEEVIKQIEKNKGAPDYGLNWPTRNPDLAMTGSQFNDALAQCKNLQEKRNLILSQALAGAFSPGSMQPKIYTTTVDGKEIKIPLYGMVRFGIQGDETIVTMDGEMSQAVADILGGNLPTSKLYEHLYSDPNITKAPFWYGSRLQAKASSYAGGALPFETKKGDKTIVSGEAMQSAEYARAQSEMYFEWLKANNIKPSEFTIGNRKTVFMPDVANTNKIVFGGGLYAKEVYQNGKIVNWQVQEGQFVQGIGDHAHESSWYDYSQGTDIIGDVFIDGKPIKFTDILSKSKYENIRKNLFSAGPRGPECRYNVPSWAKAEIAKYQSKHKEIGPRLAPEPIEIASGSQNPATSVAQTQPISSTEKPTSTLKSVANNQQQNPETSYAPASQPDLQQQPEVQNNNKVFVIGDSLSHGFVPKLKGMNITHVQPDIASNASEAQKKAQSIGQQTSTMVKTFEKMIKSGDCKGATLVIIGGSNDLFNRDMENPLSIEKTKENLSKIYKMAKAAGMKVVASTLPPLAYSSYSKKWGEKWAAKHKNLQSAKDFNDELIQKWTALNNWILQQAGTTNGPNEVIQTHNAFQDPNAPGKLRPDLYGNSDGVHLANYGPFGDLLKEGISKVQPEDVS